MATDWTIGSERWRQTLRSGAESLGVPLDSSAVDGFTAHALEMLRWNTRMNLTAITDPFEVAVKHYIDSIAPAELIPPDARLMDIGSGAGFPGIPLKILFPTLTVTLTDAVRKKVSFLNHAGRLLKLKNFRALHVRIEPVQSHRPIVDESAGHGIGGGGDLGGRFYDVVITRALASLDDVVSMALPLLVEGGRVIALKGSLLQAEIDSAKRIAERLATNRDSDCGWPAISVQRYRLPFLQDERSIVSVTLGSAGKGTVQD